MTPFSALAQRLSGSLEEAGYRPLDVWGGTIGGERHGLFDHTWISPHADGRHCFASMFMSPRSDGEGAFVAEVWAALESGPASPWSLVLRVENVDVSPSSELESNLRFAMLEAARRAQQMRWSDERESLLKLSAARRELGLERAPYRLTVEAVRALFESEPEREWRNRDVLGALLEREFFTDRAAVNSALSELAKRGAIRRVRQGRYRAG